MPIGDLLAEISGGQPSSAPSPKVATSSGIKRKAEDGSNGATSTKLTKARQPDGSYSTSKVTRDADGRVVERSYSVSRPVKATGLGQTSIKPSSLPHRTNSPSTNGRYEPPTPTSQRTTSTSNGKLPAASCSTTQSKRPSDVASRPKLNQPVSAAAKVPQSKPSPTTPTPLQSSQGPPKKGSFKDIMARAAKAQEVMGKVGMIQHKPIDKASVKKERETAKPEQKSGAGSGAKGKMSTSYTGTGRPSGTTNRGNAPAGAPARSVSKAGAAKDGKTGPKSKSGSAANDVAEKKVKKSATATTGYAGTARPAPGAATKKGPSSRGDQRPGRGGLLEPPRMGRRSKYEDEYDEELDDFIDYDDEEDDMGPRYGYDSEGSSDMEAGMSDIDTEERRAELYAREEDKREQALEEKLKREKEERRRRWAQGGR
ncbi:hypothetical protein F5B22DRAFT_596609 [Xylaria bambusicola]|uniref:uncharacterized protein n=1 Tax=Xylaria bambusicola TaxID=326684 RepID=UPI002007308A|nr:uncharacterized protein F5B22DRAFT_596609 [Xylaria bambusicola]KAI0521359.1 hypothetical protein F5B22DRAFT_596609 [Xylaria bambusicola]